MSGPVPVRGPSICGAGHVAGSDCERIRPGLVAQPVNTVSSLAFVVAAVPIWRWARTAGDRSWQRVAVSAAAAGLGSAAYHGPGGRLGKASHDLGVLALAATAVGALAAGRRRGGSADRSVVVVAVGAALVHATSRTGGPLCRPASRWQGHAGWHVLSAAALVLAARGDVADGGRATTIARPP
ncbi:MAG TPA: hypothetical protein VMM13_06250, partial [Euzebya sp.]|nr:hypothetical protein [Euzebya sp.]